MSDDLFAQVFRLLIYKQSCY